MEEFVLSQTFVDAKQDGQDIIVQCLTVLKDVIMVNVILQKYAVAM